MRRLASALPVLAFGLVLAACTANPPPPVQRTDSPKPTPTATAKDTIVVGIDEIGPGFNPHLLADLSPTSVMVSALVLPSPFRPVPDPVHPGGTLWMPDKSVLVSADVTSQAPFTVTYRLRTDAQWSDSAPISADDFHYLWQQMITQQGAVDPAGYRMIADVASSNSGKVVTVTMKQPYPAWRELFTDLLPAHLIKDLPGGFERALNDDVPVSGSLFHIKRGSVDRGRDEILLERNDRFWDQPAKPDQILLRRAGTPEQLADSMRTGDAQLADVHGGDATQAQLAAIPDVRTATAWQPRTLQLVLNGRTEMLGDVRVRRGLLGLLDQQLLATVARGFSVPSDVARAQILSPSVPGYVPTEPARLPTDAVYAGLAEAGWVRQPGKPNPTNADAPLPQLVHNNDQMKLRIGVAENDHTAIAVANTVSDQLRSAGIDAAVKTMAPGDLYGPALLAGSAKQGVDVVVGWTQAGSDPTAVLASRFGCPPAVAAPGPTLTSESEPPSDPAAHAPSNLSGVCDPSLQPAIDAALRGEGDVGKTIADAEPKLWDLATVLPIIQDRTLLAAGPGVSGASLSGAIQDGPLSDAATWTRVGQ